MNYPPPTSPSPASARNRRSGRTGGTSAPRNPRQGRSGSVLRNPRQGRRTGSVPRSPQPGRRKTAKRKGKSFAGQIISFFRLTWQQGLILAVLAVGIVAASLSLSQAQSSMRELEAKRQADWEEYQREVRSFQVKYRDWIEYYAAVNRLDPAYVAAIIKRESDYDPRAVSRKNARGLMQMMPDTFDWVRKNTGYRNADIDVLFEPEAAIKMGCYLLRYICDTMQTDDPILVACAYHAGWGNVNAWLKRYSTDGKHLTLAQIPMDDTRYYAGKVLNAYAIYQQHYY